MDEFSDNDITWPQFRERYCAGNADLTNLVDTFEAAGIELRRYANRMELGRPHGLLTVTNGINDYLIAGDFVTDGLSLFVSNRPGKPTCQSIWCVSNRDSRTGKGSLRVSRQIACARNQTRPEENENKPRGGQPVSPKARLKFSFCH